MSKYLEITRFFIKAQFAWRADVICNFIFTVSKILFAYLLWGIIFTGKTRIGGFTFQSMLSYYIVSSFLSQLEMSGRISDEMSSRIRNGTFSKYMVLPMNIQGYFISMEVGIALFYLFFDVSVAVIWVFLFRIQFVFINNIPIIVSAILMIGLGMLFMIQLNFFLGILTFKYEEISTFLRIKNNLAALVTGTIVPLVFFPEAVVGIMKLLPFYYVNYLPAMLLTGHCQNEAVGGLAVIFCWCIAIQLLLSITWRKYRKRYDGVGI